MTKRELSELLKYYSAKQLYVVRWDNRLLRLDCPFKVLVKDDIGELKKDDIVEVELVKVTLALITVFIIKDKAYFYFHFEILI